jgi:hypothetical protein
MTYLRKRFDFIDINTLAAVATASTSSLFPILLSSDELSLIMIAFSLVDPSILAFGLVLLLCLFGGEYSVSRLLS